MYCLQIQLHLKQARLSSQAKLWQNQLDVKNGRRQRLKVSPFASMSSIETDHFTARQFKSKIGRIAQAQHKTSKPGSDDIRPYAINFYKDPVQAVPGYAHFTLLPHNVLVEDDKNRTFMPWQGDDDEVQELDEDKCQVEAMIERNQNTLHQLNEKTEKARPWVPHVPALLKELGTDVDSALRYLMTEDSKFSAPPELPKELRAIWHDRSAHLKEGYFSEGSDSDVSSDNGWIRAVRRPKKQWRDALEGLSSSFDEPKHAAAGLACLAFLKMTGFSLWNVLRVIHSSQAPLAGKSRDKARIATETSGSMLHTSATDAEDVLQNTAQGGTWQEMACVICKQCVPPCTTDLGLTATTGTIVLAMANSRTQSKQTTSASVSASCHPSTKPPVASKISRMASQYHHQKISSAVRMTGQ